MNELRMVKFERWIEDINEMIVRNIPSYAKSSNNQNVALRLIFDYDSCNDYAKIIINKSVLFLEEYCGADGDALTRYRLISFPHDSKGKMEMAKLFVNLCRQANNKNERYKFIFWSLLILTVDKNNAQDYLSLICDFTRMLDITNEEFEDIVYAIKYVYHKEDKDYKFKSRSTIVSPCTDVKSVFAGLFQDY